MSKILRRPMFRGGRVDSRGTGITSGLGYATGGRVGYKQGNFVTGADLLRLAEEKGTTLGPINPKSIYTNQPSIGAGFNFLTTPSISKPKIDIVSSDLNFNEDEDPLTKLLNEAVKTKTDAETLSSTAPVYDETETEGGALDVSNLIKKEEDKDKDKEKNKIIKDDDDTTTVGLKDFETNAAEYAKLLGIEKARSRDIGDMLARISASALKRPARGEKRGLTDVLADFMSEEAKAPSRSEAIEQAAAKLAISGKQAADLAFSKAQLKAYTDAYRTYAPAKEVKLYEFLKKRVGEQDALRIALGGEKNFATLLNKRAKDLGLPKLPTDSFKNVVREFYGESYEGDLPNIDQSELDGVYTIPGTSRIVIYDKGKLRKDTTY